MSAQRFKTAVVIGKFYPPHLGHHHLIDSALRQAESVDVLVCHKPSQAIPGELRVGWLRAVHPAARVWSVDDTLGDDDTAAWARFTLDFLGFCPDAVFSSEDYGEPYSRAMGCRHVMVDRERRVVPVSGTLLRTRPQENLVRLHPLVRAWFVPRVALVGAESSGKTSLAQALAAHYGCAWMPEYGREYCARKYGDQPFAEGQQTDTSVWESQEFLHIAQEHARREDALAGQQERLLVVDTDSLATGVWHERYLGEPSPELAALVEERRPRYALWLLCGTEIPWVQDGTRDSAGERQAMQARFEAVLRNSQRPWRAIAGPPEERLAQALEAIAVALAAWRPFGLPQG